MEGLEEDIKEVDSLLSVAVRPLVRGRLALLLSDLQQVCDSAFRCHVRRSPKIGGDFTKRVIS